MPQDDDEPEFDYGPNAQKTYLVTNTLETPLPSEFVFSTNNRYIEIQNVKFVDLQTAAKLPTRVFMHADLYTVMSILIRLLLKVTSYKHYIKYILLKDERIHLKFGSLGETI